MVWEVGASAGRCYPTTTSQAPKHCAKMDFIIPILYMEKLRLKKVKHLPGVSKVGWS
jgi:hypothetical protein